MLKSPYIPKAKARCRALTQALHHRNDTLPAIDAVMSAQADNIGCGRGAEFPGVEGVRRQGGIVFVRSPVI